MTTIARAEQRRLSEPAAPRPLKRLHHLQYGMTVLTPDDESWVIESTSTMNASIRICHRWVWLRRGNTYRKIGGQDIWDLRLLPAPAPPPA